MDEEGTDKKPQEISQSPKPIEESQEPNSPLQRPQNVIKSDESEEEEPPENYVPSMAVIEMQTTNLQSLVDAEFVDTYNDKDFEFSKDQIIKCCKILLHKVNY